MKYNIKKQKYTIVYFTLLVLMSFFIVSTEQNYASTTKENNNSTTGTKIEIKIFSSRYKLFKDDKFSILCFLNFNKKCTVNTKLLYPKDLLQIEGDSSRTLHASESITEEYIFHAIKEGTANIIFQVKQLVDGRLESTTIKSINNIAIQNNHSMISKYINNSLLGVFTGTFLTLLLTYLNDYRRKSQETKQKVKWLKQILPANLDILRADIINSNQIEYGVIINKLFSEGYYAQLYEETIMKKRHLELPHTILNLNELFKSYETRREKNRIDEKFKSEIINHIDNTIAQLQKL